MELETVAEPWSGLAEMRPVVQAFLFRRCRDESEAEDIVQDTLIRASRYRGSLSEAKCLRPWLMRIALNVLRDHVKRERRLPRVEADHEILDRLEGREDVPGDVREDVQVEFRPAVLRRRWVQDARPSAGEALLSLLRQLEQLPADGCGRRLPLQSAGDRIT